MARKEIQKNETGYAKYEVISTCYIGDRLWEPDLGENSILTVPAEFPGGWHLKPLNDVARAACPHWNGIPEDPLPSFEDFDKAQKMQKVQELAELIRGA